MKRKCREHAMFKKLFYFFLVSTFLCVLALAAVGYWFVVLHPGDEIQVDNIKKILSKESDVFYNDGVTKLGVFFDSAHRQYVNYGQIPQAFVDALVASEDNRFFSHIGFDVVGIVRAAVRNLEAGKVVQGGSSLTQQTAKNLFKRTDRSLQAKLKELLFALRLEYHYPKEKIFEFYANQFFVSGNGHGLGVAARYYFDKQPEELTLVECAFIAGSVKRPNFYNPFIKKTDEAEAEARRQAAIRKNYVLDQMLEMGMINEPTYNQARASEIRFRQGRVGYSLDYALEMVKDAVSSSEVQGALAVHGIANVATSGVRIITTVDRNLQEETLYALRRELSRLDVRLSGFERAEVQARLKDLDYGGDGTLKKQAFVFGRIAKISGKGADLAIEVLLDNRLGRGIIDRRGLDRMIEARVKWAQDLWAEPAARDEGRLLSQLQVGDRLWVSVRDMNADGTAILDLEKFPEIQGGAMVLKDGAIRAMAGGVENRFFNRAVYARRTMGSSFKPFVYAAALQLGWNSADLLANKRDIFIFQGVPYFPRPDHISPFETVSMSWAGVHSENLASVWLAAHLCDHLDPQQFREVAERLGLAPQKAGSAEEPYKNYRDRIRDKHGIHINDTVLRSAAFRVAVNNLEADFIFEGMLGEYRTLKKLHYGLGFEKIRERIYQDFASGRAGSFDNDRKELSSRQGILSESFLALAELRRKLRTYILHVEDPLGPFEPDSFSSGASSAELFYDQATGEYIFRNSGSASPSLQRVGKADLRRILSFFDDREYQAFFDKIKLNGKLSVAAYDLTERQIEAELQRLKQLPPYSFEVLAAVDDFRILVGLRYLIEFARQLGVGSQLDPVLSFPLGANVVTLLEMTRVYEGLVTGKVSTYGYEKDEDKDVLAVLDRIETASGEILYRPHRRVKTVVDAKTSIALGHILENVVKYGTGRQADKGVRLHQGQQPDGKKVAGLPVPLFGKTGTANRYTNASFYGYLPGLAEKGSTLTMQGGYTVGVYVGYDDNKVMKRSSTRITGAAGALPAWIDIVNMLIREKGYAQRLETADSPAGGISLLRDNLGQFNFAAAAEQGGVVSEPTRVVAEGDRYQPSVMTFGQLGEGGGLVLTRNFQPFWRNTREDQVAN
jgi:penicillin-binding protein 1A